MSVVLINCTGETFTPTRSGAISTWNWEVCRAAQRQGHEPWVISRSTNADPHPWQRTVFLDYPWIPQFRGTGLGRLLEWQRKLGNWGHVRQGAYARRVLRAIRENGLSEMPFILHNDPEMAVHLRRCFPSAKILHLFHNTNTCGESCRRAYPRAVTVAAGVSDFTSRWEEGYFGMPAGSVQTVYNGVDIEAFTPAQEPPSGLPVINFVGRTDATKAPDLILKAALKIAETTQNFSVQILGARFYWGTEPDDYQRELDTLSKALEAKGVTVRRPGVIPRPALPGELRKAHIHVVPSRWEEPFGLTTVEGMATGLAIVASRTGGTTEIVGDSGLLFERDDVDGLAAHLARLLADPGLRADYGRLARARAEKFTWDETWARLGYLTGVSKAAKPEPQTALR
jgi:glycosyltransferase involved in cell wall biosynthesis